MKIYFFTHFSSGCCLFIALLTSAAIHSQSLSGKVNDTGGKPIINVNVLLLKSADSSLVKAAVSDKTGNYRLTNILPGSYILSASMVGYKTAFSTSVILIRVNSQNVNVPVFTLSENVKQLNEVTIKRPFIVQGIDRTIVNVANSIVMSGGTALEVLEKAPGITVDQQNSIISLMGKEGVIVYINGKRSYLSPSDVMALLKTMPADNIDNIELITNPAAKYDADGNAGIIDIRLKKNDNIGTHGNLSLSAGTGRYDREQASIRLNHRTAIFNLFGSYATNRSNDLWSFDLKRDWSQDGERNIVNNISPIRFRGVAHNASAGIDYFLGKTTVVGLIWSGQWNNWHEKAPADASFRSTPTGPVYYQTHSAKAISDPTYNHVLNANFQHNFHNNDGQLTADFDLGYFRRMFENSLLTTTVIPFDPGEPRTGMLTTMPVRIDVRSVKADYSRTLSKHWKMETGIKSSWVQSDNNQVLLSGVENNLKPDSGLSEHFQYTEQINAAYLHFAGELKGGTKLQGGLRAELTHSVGNAISHSNKVAKEYANIFPSGLISQPLGKDEVLTLSYSYRIDRPGYQSLNPVRSYLDPFAYSRGNPFLKPQYTHSLELKHGFKQKIFTSLNAAFISGLISYIIQPVNLKQYERVPENMGHAQSYSFVVSFPLELLPCWKMQSTLMGLYSRFHFTYLDQPVIAKQAGSRLNITNAFSFKKGWSAELSGELSSPSVEVISHIPWMGYMNAGVQKSFGLRWKLRLNVEDILYTRKIALEHINTAGFYMHTLITYDSRVATVNATYSFGNQKLKEARQRKTASEEEMSRTN